MLTVNKNATNNILGCFLFIYITVHVVQPPVYFNIWYVEDMILWYSVVSPVNVHFNIWVLKQNQLRNTTLVDPWRMCHITEDTVCKCMWPSPEPEDEKSPQCVCVCVSERERERKRESVYELKDWCEQWDSWVMMSTAISAAYIITITTKHTHTHTHTFPRHNGFYTVQSVYFLP